MYRRKMSELPTHIKERQAGFVTDLKDEFGDAVDWIGSGSPERSVGLAHLSDRGEEYFNRNPLEVQMGGSTAGLSLGEVDEFHESVVGFANRNGVAVRQTGGDPNVFEYTFFLHGRFLNVEA